MNHGKLEVVKQELARVNVDILGISEQKWTGMGEFKSDDNYIYYCRQESLRRNGVAIVVNERVQNAVLGYNLKNDRMNSADYHGYSVSSKGFLPIVVDIMVICIKFAHPVHKSSLIPKMSMFTLAISCLTTSNYFDSWT